MNLNAGCGFKRKKNWVNLDKYQQLNPDIVADLDKGLPFKNEIFEKILLSHVLEHISDVVFTMNELYRVMKSGGIMTIEVPEFPTHGSIADPSHKHFFTRNSFRYFVVDGALPGIDLWKPYKKGIQFSQSEKTILMKVELEKP